VGEEIKWERKEKGREEIERAGKETKGEEM